MQFIDASYGIKPKSKYSHNAKAKPWQMFAALGVVVVILILATSSTSNPVKQAIAPYTTSATSSQVNNNLCSALKTLQITVFDGLGSQVVNAPTLNIYNGLAVSESPTVSSSGVATTGNKYNTGQTLILKLSSGTPALATEFLPIQVPPISCGDTSTSNSFSVYAVALGAWTITVGAQGGSTLTSGNQYFLSQFPGGLTGYTTFTVQMSESTANAGYKTSVDIVNSIAQNMVVQLKDTATSLSVTGLPHATTVGTTRYWFLSCPDGISGLGYSNQGGQGAFQEVGVPGQSGGADSLGSVSTNPANGQPLQYPGYVDSQCQGSLSQEKLGNTVYGGVASFSFSASAGSVASGSSETITIGMYKYSNIPYFLATTSLGPNSAQVGAPVGSSAGTDFSVKLMNL